MYLDDQGRLILPKEAIDLLRLSPGDQVQIEENHSGLHFNPRFPPLAKIYVEPTSVCNLKCRMCIRNVWNETTGSMSDAVFDRILEGIRSCAPPPSVIFGGFGEPLAHHGIVDMVSQTKAERARVEIITNGTLLNEACAQDLIDAGLDRLWVSLDGAQPEGYADVRLGADIQDVLTNIERFAAMRVPRQHPVPEIGIVFVAMKRNIGDLPQLLVKSRELGATHFMVTNLWPHTDELREEILYTRTLASNDCLGSADIPALKAPRMDIHEWAREPLYQAICGRWNMHFVGGRNGFEGNHCPFIEDNALAIAWDGSVSPCLPLLHSSEGYLNRVKRFNSSWPLGNVAEHQLLELWGAPEHVEFRGKVRDFDFAPCAICDGCPQSETNDEDCYGNTFPTCGGCLWAWGIIQCP